MLSAFLGFIPVLGPLLQGILGLIGTVLSDKVQVAQIEANTTVSGMQYSNQLTMAFAHDIPVRMCRDLIMFPGSIYCGTIIWDRFMSLRHPELVWGVLPLTGALQYLPYALLTFFFGAAFLYWNPWKQK